MDINLIFQTIGTLASISSVPMAVVFFQKQKKSNVFETKKEILRKISYIVADENELTSVEVLSIIKSTLRGNNIKETKVLATEIIEDMITEIITNPLLDGSRKLVVNNNLKQLMNEFLIITTITSMKSEDQKKYLIKISEENNKSVEDKNDLINKINNEKVLNVNLNKRNRLKDSIMAVIAIVVSIVSSVLAGYTLLLKPHNIKDFIIINVNWLVLFGSIFAVFSLIYVLIPRKKRT